MQKAILLFILFLPGVFARSQETQNSLLPSQLLVENLCPVSYSFYDRSHWQGLYHSMVNCSGGILSHILADQATNPHNTVVGAWESRYFPYDIEKYKSLNRTDIFKSLGGEIDTFMSDEGKRVFFRNIDTSEIEAVQFIESWELDTAKGNFSKIVKGYIPIRKYLTHEADRYMISKTCLIVQNKPTQQTKNRKLIAKVKYEVLLVDQDEDVTTCLANSSSDRQALLFRYELFNSPLLTSYSRYMLVQYLEDKAIQKMEPCYDFRTNLLITDKDTVEKAFGYSYSRIPMINRDGTITDTLVQEKTGYINSLIFCEEWYMDPETGYFSKEVAGIAPVVWDGNTGEKSVNIVLWFDEKKKF